MRISLKSVTAGVTTLAVAGVMAVAGATGAAAAPPPYDPDGDAYGTLTFYDAAGSVVTSGDASDPESIKYAVASTNLTSPVTIKRASTYLYTPVAGTPAGNWTGTQLSGNTLYPIAAAPAVVSSSAFPAAETVAAAVSMKDAAVAVPQLTTGLLANVYQVRLKNFNVPDYASASITIHPVTNVWQQVFPVVADSTKTVLTVSGANPAGAPASPTLTATVSRTAGTQTPLPAGNVEFFNGTTSLGLPSAVNAAGVATKALTNVPVGSYSYTAVFTPTTATAFRPSTSSVVPFVVQVGATVPVIGLTASPAASNVGDAVTFTASIAPAAATGTIQFFDGANSLAPASATSSTFTTSALLAGQHQVTARFVSANPALFANATSPVVTVTVSTVLQGACATTPTNCTDPQAFIAEVAAGSLVISTPYHTVNPFNLGVLALNATGTELTSGLKSFAQQDPTNAGITITDTRAGDNAWTANLQSSDFSSGNGTIAAKNLGFTQVAGSYIPGNALQAGDVLFTDNPAFSNATAATQAFTGLAASKTFAAAAAPGVGTVYVNGNFTLNAPTSTPAGNYFGTVTFTIA